MKTFLFTTASCLLVTFSVAGYGQSSIVKSQTSATHSGGSVDDESNSDTTTSHSGGQNADKDSGSKNAETSRSNSADNSGADNKSSIEASNSGTTATYEGVATRPTTKTDENDGEAGSFEKIIHPNEP